MDETDSGTLSDGIYADNSSVPRFADIPRQYAFRTWNNACIKRSSRIAQQFGLDSSVKVNMTSIVHATTTAVNLTRSVARAAK